MPATLRCVPASLPCSIPHGAPAWIATSVRFNGMSHALLDLDPNDGITPGATFARVGEGTASFDGTGSGGRAAPCNRMRRP